MSALQEEVEPFGIGTTIVNPGWFRTGLAGPKSAIWLELIVPDYAERSAALVVGEPGRPADRRA